MNFYNDAHEANFADMLQRFPIAKTDPEYRVGCYIVAVPEIYAKATRQQWGDLFDEWTTTEDFSSGFRVLLDLGIHLFGGGSHPVNLSDGIAAWDTGNFEVFRQACEIRKGWA